MPLLFPLLLEEEFFLLLVFLEEFCVEEVGSFKSSSGVKMLGLKVSGIKEPSFLSRY